MGKISEVRYTLPNVDVIHQVDFKRAPGDPKDDPETNIHKYGCRYMCMLTMCQYFAGRALSRNQILTIYHKAINGELGNNVMEQNCTTGENEERIIHYALDLLGKKKYTIRQVRVKSINNDAGDWNISNWNTGDLPGKDVHYFVIVDFNTFSNSDYGGHHFVLFSGAGNFMYDPSNGQVKSYKNVNKLLFYKVLPRK